jgi:nucleoside-diphosphate kinase
MQRGLAGEVISRLERRGLKIVAIRMLKVNTALAKQHYAEHDGKPFFKGLVEYITSSPIIAAVFEGNGAIKATRQTMGLTNPLEAAPGSIRADFGLEKGRNLTHASDSPTSARREIGLFFGDAPPIAWKRDTDAWVFE